MKPYRLRDVLTLFFDPRVFPLFLVGSLALAVAGNAVYDLLIDWLGDQPKGQWMIVVWAILILVLAALVFSAIMRLLRKQELVITSQPNPQKRRGLIFLFSQEEPLAKAFSYHQPELSICWLICTQDSREQAESFKEAHGNEIKSVVIKTIQDPFDWRETKQIVDEIYKSLPEGWTENDIITDLTGITKPVSAGAVLACWSAGRPMEYVPATYELKSGRRAPRTAGDPIEIKIGL